MRVKTGPVIDALFVGHGPQRSAQVTRGFEPTAQIAPRHFTQVFGITGFTMRIRAKVMRQVRQGKISFEHAAVINQQPSRTGKAALNQPLPDA